MQTVTSADFDRGNGGFWITDQGDLLHVEHYAEHCETLRRVMGWDGYHDAYERGWIRVSTYHGTGSVDVDIEMATVTMEALRELAQVLRHDRMAKFGRKFEMDKRGVDYPKNYCKFPDADAMARAVMQIAIEKNAARKQAEQEAEEARTKQHDLLEGLLAQIDAALERPLEETVH